MFHNKTGARPEAFNSLFVRPGSLLLFMEA